MKELLNRHKLLKLWFVALILLTCGTSCSNFSSPNVQITEGAQNLPFPTVQGIIPSLTNTPISTATDTPGQTPTNSITQEIISTPYPDEIDATNFQNLLELKEDAVQFSDILLAVTWNPDGNILALSKGESLVLYDREDQEIIFEAAVGVYSRAIEFDPINPQIIATGGNDGFIRLWDINSGKIIQEIIAHSKGVNQLAFQPGGNLIASAGNDGMVYLWEPSTGERMQSLIGGAFVVPDLKFTENGARIVTVDGGVIRLREVESGRLVISIRTGGSVPAIALSPDGYVAAVAREGGVIQLWDLTNGELLSEVRASEESEAWTLVYNNKGDLLATGWRDGSICWLPVANLENYFCVRGHERPVSTVLFSPDGRTVLSASYDGWLRQWQVFPTIK